VPPDRRRGVTITAVGKLDKKALREILAAPGGA
jgi:hypothetical protein